MKFRSVAVLVLLLASSTAAQTVILEDSEGDAKASAGGAAEIPAGASDVNAFDLLSLTLDERTSEFDFIVNVVSLAKEPKSELDNGFIFVDFQHEDASYRIRFAQQVIAQQISYGAELMIFDQGRQNYVFMDRLDLDINEAGGLLTATVPRDHLLDGNGTAPTLGREFTLWKASSRATTIFADGFSPYRVDDAMPDSGFGELDYAIQQGLRQTGHARLFSDNPVRASNGEQATFVYYVEAENLDDTDDRFDLSVEGVPSGWSVTLPAPTIRIDGNGTQQFPILVSTPFAHSHGSFEDFVLKMTSHRDSGSVGQIQMGIRYLEIPQPAGHHDRIWIHTRSEFNTQGIALGPIFTGGQEDGKIAYMNAEESHENNEGIEVPPDETFCCPIGEAQYNWQVFLEPGLQLGLDFDINETGSLDLEFTSDVPFNDAVLSGYLVHYGVLNDNQFFGPQGGDATVLGEFAPSPSTNINGPTRFTTVFTPKDIADLVPYKPGAALAMQLTLTTQSYDVVGVEQLLPRLMSGGELQLPLFEYRDPVERVFNALAGIDFDYADRSDKFVNPTETVLFNLTLTNEGAVDDTFELRVNGTNEGWARILGDSTVFIPTGASRPVVVEVTPPKEALDGDVVDLIVTAASDAEPTTQGNIRVVAVVDTLIDRADESKYVTDVAKQLTSDKDSPGLPLVGLLGAMAVAMLRSKRS